MEYLIVPVVQTESLKMGIIDMVYSETVDDGESTLHLEKVVEHRGIKTLIIHEYSIHNIDLKIIKCKDQYFCFVPEHIIGKDEDFIEYFYNDIGIVP